MRPIVYFVKEGLFSSTKRCLPHPSNALTGQEKHSFDPDKIGAQRGQGKLPKRSYFRLPANFVDHAKGVSRLTKTQIPSTWFDTSTLLSAGKITTGCSPAYCLPGQAG